MVAITDLSALNYDEWLGFVFDHPIHEPLWHFSENWDYELSDPGKVLGYIDTLFNNPAPLLRRFSQPHIDQGFWFLPGPNGLMWLLASLTVPWESRRRTIRSMEPLFRDFFAQVELGSSVYMWWDSLFTYSLREDRDLFSDREALREVAAVMGRLSHSHVPAVRESANHGIQHLRDVAVRERDQGLQDELKSVGLWT